MSPTSGRSSQATACDVTPPKVVRPSPLPRRQEALYLRGGQPCGRDASRTMRFIVTGTAGFIGFHLARRLLDDGHEVIGIDGFTHYYDLGLKERRAALLEGRQGFCGHRVVLEDFDAMAR